MLLWFFPCGDQATGCGRTRNSHVLPVVVSWPRRLAYAPHRRRLVIVNAWFRDDFRRIRHMIAAVLFPSPYCVVFKDDTIPLGDECFIKIALLKNDPQKFLKTAFASCEGRRRKENADRARTRRLQCRACLKLAAYLAVALSLAGNVGVVQCRRWGMRRLDLDRMVLVLICAALRRSAPEAQWIDSKR